MIESSNSVYGLHTIVLMQYRALTWIWHRICLRQRLCGGQGATSQGWRDLSRVYGVGPPWVLQPGFLDGCCRSGNTV